MRIKAHIKTFDLFTHIFFLIYFISYIGENTSLKYVGIIIYQLFLLVRFGNKNKTNRDKRLTAIIVFVFISLLISLFVNFNSSGVLKTLSLIDLFIIVYFMFPREAIRSRLEEEHLISIITNTLLFALLVAFVLYYNDTVSSYGRSSIIAVRHAFGMGAVSVVGFLCFIEFVLSLYLFMESKKSIRKKAFESIKIAFPLYMAVLADIRSAIVAMALFVLVYWFYKMPKNRSTFIFKFLIILGFLLFSTVYLTMNTVDINRLDYVLSHRLLFYRQAIDDIITRHAVLFGVGSFRNSEVSLLKMVQVDNAYIDVLYQYGLFALILFLFLLIKIGVDLYKINADGQARDKRERKYIVFMNSLYISVLGYSMVEKNLFSISSALSFVTFMLVFWAIEKYRKPNETTTAG